MSDLITVTTDHEVMRVLYLTEEPIRFEAPMTRGGAIHVHQVVTGLHERGHDVHLID